MTAGRNLLKQSTRHKILLKKQIPTEYVRLLYLITNRH